MKSKKLNEEVNEVEISTQIRKYRNAMELSQEDLAKKVMTCMLTKK